MDAPPPLPPDDRPSDAAALLAAMADVRGRVGRHAADVSAAAKRSADWTSYVRAAPLACAAGAAVAGYLIVPTRPRRPKVVKVKGGAKGSGPTATVERPVSGRGPWMGMLSALGNVAVRAGTAYLSQKAGAAFGAAAAESDSPDPKRPSPAGHGPAGNGRPFGGPR